ncbi:MAG: hypothetical protein NVSMB23_27240 [Myxococcales bacterium]
MLAEDAGEWALSPGPVPTMLTWLSRSLQTVLGAAAPAAAESLRSAPVSPVGGAAFVAGEGARVYSLDAFRRLRAGPKVAQRSPHAA